MNLKNHVCTDSIVNGVKFTAKIVESKGLKNVRTLDKLQGEKFIVVHNTGNTAPTAGDETHATYIQNVENADKEYVSWHLTVDADSATQHLPFNEVGYHAGDGKGVGNRQGIGIEIAENKDYPNCEANGIKIICALMHEYNIPIERALPHRYFATNKKLCPWRILKSQETWERDWKVFQNKILQEYIRLYPTVSSEPANTVVKFELPGGSVVGIFGQLTNGSTYVQARPLLEALGYSVDWDDKTKTVLVNTKKAGQ